MFDRWEKIKRKKNEKYSQSTLHLILYNSQIEVVIVEKHEAKNERKNSTGTQNQKQTYGS